MIYNLAIDTEVKSLESRLLRLIEKGVRVEVTEKKQKRSLSQNAYLHVVFSLSAIEYASKWLRKISVISVPLILGRPR